MQEEWRCTLLIKFDDVMKLILKERQCLQCEQEMFPEELFCRCCGAMQIPAPAYVPFWRRSRWNQVFVLVLGFWLIYSVFMLLTWPPSQARSSLAMGSFFGSGVFAVCFSTRKKWLWFSAGCVGFSVAYQAVRLIFISSGL